MTEDEVRAVVRAALEEFVGAERERSEPAYKVELEEERKRRSGLEEQVKALTSVAEEARRSAAIRAELQRLGVVKVDLAYRAVKDELARDGVDMKEYLAQFAVENPELMPARLAGGSGASANAKQGSASSAVDLEQIRPGMNPEELDRVRQEIARIAMQTMRGV